jgi:hypothetical protein
MRIKKLIAFFFVLFAISTTNAQTKKFTIHTVAFYNFENLFDTINGTNNDEEWLPDGTQNWTSNKYKQKLHNLARVISEIGSTDNPNNSPTLIGGCEIENTLPFYIKRNILNLLVIKTYHYWFTEIKLIKLLKIKMKQTMPPTINQKLIKT